MAEVEDVEGLKWKTLRTLCELSRCSERRRSCWFFPGPTAVGFEHDFTLKWCRLSLKHKIHTSGNFVHSMHTLYFD